MVQCACQAEWVPEVLGALWVQEGLWGPEVVWDLEDQGAMDLQVMDPTTMALEETWAVTLVEVQWGRQEGVQWHLAIATWDLGGKALDRHRETLGCSRSLLQGP